MSTELVCYTAHIGVVLMLKIKVHIGWGVGKGILEIQKSEEQTFKETAVFRRTT